MEDSRPQDQFMRSNATQTPDADADADADADGSYDLDGVQIHDQGTARLRASVGEELGVFLCGQSENICADLSEFLEGNALDLEFDCEQDLSQQLREYTLQQWIMKSKPEVGLHTAH